MPGARRRRNGARRRCRLVLYEINIAEFAGGLERSRDVLAYLADLGVNASRSCRCRTSPARSTGAFCRSVISASTSASASAPTSRQWSISAHQHGIAVIVDAVYGHTGVDFPYYDAYTRLRYHENPFMGPSPRITSATSARARISLAQLTRDFFYTVNQHWLEVYHVDGFRYDCVPNYWDGPLGVGYASLVYETYQLAKSKIAQGEPCGAASTRAPGQPLALVQMAEQLEDPRACCARPTRTAPGKTAPSTRRRRSRMATGGGSPTRSILGLFGYPEQETTNGDVIPKSALQYIENHDHERFLCNFGIQPG